MLLLYPFTWRAWILRWGSWICPYKLPPHTQAKDCELTIVRSMGFIQRPCHLTWYVGKCIKPTFWRWAWHKLWQTVKHFKLPTMYKSMYTFHPWLFFWTLRPHLLVWNELGQSRPFRPMRDLRATSHMRLRSRDHFTSYIVIGGKGRAGPSSHHNKLEGPTE